MGALLGDASFVEDDDLVGVAQSGDAVGDEEGGASLHDLSEVTENRLLSVGVDRRKGVVENEDRRLADERPGQGGALFLAAGEGDAALADEGVEAALELLDVLAQLGLLRGEGDLFRSGIFDAVGDVGADRIGEQEGVLRDVADIGAQFLERPFLRRNSIDAQLPRAGLDEARNQAGQRGLARTDAADDAQRSAGRDLQVDVAEDGDIAVGEGEIVELDVAGDAFQVGRFAADDVGARVCFILDDDRWIEFSGRDDIVRGI